MFILQTAITEDLSLGGLSLSSAERRAEKKRAKENTTIIEGLNEAQHNLSVATQNFNFVTDPLLVDMYAYRIKAAETEYRYLLNLARQQGLVCQEHCEKVSNQPRF